MQSAIRELYGRVPVIAPKIVEPFSPERGIDWGVDQLGVDPHPVVVW